MHTRHSKNECCRIKQNLKEEFLMYEYLNFLTEIQAHYFTFTADTTPTSKANNMVQTFELSEVTGRRWWQVVGLKLETTATVVSVKIMASPASYNNKSFLVDDKLYEKHL